MQRRLSKVRAIDLFGRRPELCFRGSKSHKTWCGSMCTVYIFIACLISALYYGQQFFERRNPSIMVNEIIDSLSTTTENYNSILPFGEISLSTSSFFLMISLSNQSDTIRLSNYNITVAVYSNTAILFSYKGVTCDKSPHFEREILASSPTLKSSMQYLKEAKEDPTKFICLGGEGVDPISTPFVYDEQNRIQITLSCDTYANKDCKELSGHQMSLVLTDYLKMPSNLEMPLTPFMRDYHIPIDVTSTEFYDLLLQKVRFTTESGFLFETKSYHDEVVVQEFRKRSSITKSTGNPLFILNIIPSPRRQIYDRNYPKILTLVGLIGGLMKSLMVIGAIITKPFSKLSMRTQLVNQLFTFEKKNNKLKIPINRLSTLDNDDQHEKGEGDEEHNEHQDVSQDLPNKTYGNAGAMLDHSQILDTILQTEEAFVPSTQQIMDTTPQNNQKNQQNLLFPPSHSSPFDVQIKEEQNQNDIMQNNTLSVTEKAQKKRVQFNSRNTLVVQQNIPLSQSAVHHEKSIINDHNITANLDASIGGFMKQPASASFENKEDPLGDAENPITVSKIPDPFVPQPRVNMEKSTLGSSRRIKSYFSEKTKQITNFIRLNIQLKNEIVHSAGKSNCKSEESPLQKDSHTQKELKKFASMSRKHTEKQFEGILHAKQEKSMSLSIKDYINYFSALFCSMISKKSTQIENEDVKRMKYTHKKVKKRLDIIYILEKLIEIDKLKVLLLDSDQINLFDYMPKEFVSIQSDNFEESMANESKRKNKLAAWSLLCSEKSQLDKYSNACIAYHHIQQNPNKNKTDKKLIQMLDPQVKRYFTQTPIIQEDLTRYRGMFTSHTNDEFSPSPTSTKLYKPAFSIVQQNEISVPLVNPPNSQDVSFAAPFAGENKIKQTQQPVENVMTTSTERKHIDKLALKIYKSQHLEDEEPFEQTQLSPQFSQNPSKPQQSSKFALESAQKRKQFFNKSMNTKTFTEKPEIEKTEQTIQTFSRIEVDAIPSTRDERLSQFVMPALYAQTLTEHEIPRTGRFEQRSSSPESQPDPFILSLPDQFNSTSITLSPTKPFSNIP